MGSRPIYILLSVLLTSWEVSSEQALQRQLDSRGEATDATGLAPGLPARLNEALKAKQSLGSLESGRAYIQHAGLVSCASNALTSAVSSLGAVSQGMQYSTVRYAAPAQQHWQMTAGSSL